MNNKIVMIKRENLQPHPDNPRKDLGDLTELRESIRENGIMQNLTVIPMTGLVDSGDFQILIGHRRFAASEGILDELPCVVVDDLTDKEQVGIMLAENMQRSDLTYEEQAHGFQMMMDLGDTVESIAQKTGFSKQTVKHRLAIAELDPETLREVQKYFQPTIADYIALEKVKDIEKRNEILNDSTNSRDIQDGVEDYLRDVQEQEEFAYYKKIFEEAGWICEIDNRYFYYMDGYKTIDGILNKIELLNDHPLIPEEKLKKLMAEVKGEVHFGLCYHSIMCRTYKEPKSKKSDEEAEKKRKAAEALKRKNKSALHEIRAQICDAYMDFILNSELDGDLVNPKTELGYVYNILDVMRDDNCSFYNLSAERTEYQIRDRVSLKGYNKPESNPFKDFDNWTPLFQLLANVWWGLASGYNHFEDYDCKPKMDRLKTHQTFCSILKDLGGFHINEEWKTVLDGTSDLYIKEDK